jgi:O-methyltransferase
MSFLRKNIRKVAAALYPRHLTAFDVLNANVDFEAFGRTARLKAELFPDRTALFRWLNESLNDQPIDYLEFGVAAGDSIRLWSGLNRHPDSRFFGFDTFEGLPEDWTRTKPAGTFDNEGRFPDIPDERVTFVKGLFQSTLYEFLGEFAPRGRLVVHVDCDLYSAALFCLSVLDRRLVPGSLVLFDEFYGLRHEFAAFRDYTRSFYREMRLIGHTDPYLAQAAFEMGGFRNPLQAG